MNREAALPDDSSGEKSRPAVARELCRVVREIHTRGWCLGTSGNFSVTVAKRPLELLITRSGRDKGRLRPDDLVVVDGRGEPADPAGRPSAETLLHCVLARRAGAGATLHTHSVAGTLVGEHFCSAGGLTLGGYEMLKGLAGIRTHETEVFVPVVGNTQDMRALSGEIEALLDHRPGLHGFLIAGHGLYTWGRNLREAHRHVEILEFLLECVARRTGFAPIVTAVQPGGRSGGSEEV